LFRDVKPVTLFGSFKLSRLFAWDESAKKLVGFRRVAELRSDAARAVGPRRTRVSR
jgi:hypothetical protein